jgi:hypothetical protein
MDTTGLVLVGIAVLVGLAILIELGAGLLIAGAWLATCRPPEAPGPQAGSGNASSPALTGSSSRFS